MEQPDLIPDERPDSEKLRARLAAVGWQTRRDLHAQFGWSDRQIREAAESLGPEVTRSQAGFKLTADLDRPDLPLALQAADAAISQGKRMIRYGLALRKKLHALLG